MDYYTQSPDPDAAQHQPYGDYDGVQPDPLPPLPAEPRAAARAARGGNNPRPLPNSGAAARGRQRGPPPPVHGGPARTVYKKAPGAPKRFKSSYVHFFTNFVQKKKGQLGPDGLVSSAARLEARASFFRSMRKCDYD